MRVLVGTSGFSFPEWKGTFYPAKIKGDAMLGWYAARLPVVEINNTFYRMPSPEVMASWAETAPPPFEFVLKAPQRITHRERLESSEDSVRALLERSAPLGSGRSAFLFQLPPFLKADVPRLEAFLSIIPAGTRVAFEFRHASWFTDDTFEALRKAGAALCIAESEKLETPFVATADWGYVRLREMDYDDAQIEERAAKIAAQKWDRAYAFLKHEVQGPELARRLAAALEKLGVEAPLGSVQP